MEIISQFKKNNTKGYESEKPPILNIVDKKANVIQFQGNSTMPEKTTFEMKSNKQPMKFVCRKIENSSEIAFTGPDSSFCSRNL